MLTASISKNGLLLFLFAAATAGILALTYVNTKDTIAAAERAAAQKALAEIVPTDRIDNDLMTDRLPIPTAALETLGLNGEDNSIAIAKKNDRTVAVIVPTIATDGYSGDIKFLYSIFNVTNFTQITVISFNISFN